jgi:hypothetical protein
MLPSDKFVTFMSDSVACRLHESDQLMSAGCQPTQTCINHRSGNRETTLPDMSVTNLSARNIVTAVMVDYVALRQVRHIRNRQRGLPIARIRSTHVRLSTDRAAVEREQSTNAASIRAFTGQHNSRF